MLALSWWWISSAMFCIGFALVIWNFLFERNVDDINCSLSTLTLSLSALLLLCFVHIFCNQCKGACAQGQNRFSEPHDNMQQWSFLNRWCLNIMDNLILFTASSGLRFSKGNDNVACKELCNLAGLQMFCFVKKTVFVFLLYKLRVHFKVLS